MLFIEFLCHIFNEVFDIKCWIIIQQKRQVLLFTNFTGFLYFNINKFLADEKNKLISRVKF